MYYLTNAWAKIKMDAKNIPNVVWDLGGFAEWIKSLQSPATVFRIPTDLRQGTLKYMRAYVDAVQTIQPGGGKRYDTGGPWG